MRLEEEAISTDSDDNAIGDITSVVCKRVGGFPAVEPKQM